MSNIKIFQNQYPIPNIDNQRLTQLEREIKQAQQRLQGTEPESKPLGELQPIATTWWKLWEKPKPAKYADPQNKLDKIEARFQQLDTIVVHYDELIHILQSYRNDYITFFDRVSSDVCLVIEEKAKRIQAIEQKRLTKHAQSRSAQTAVMYQQQQGQIWNTVRKLSDAAVLALKKLELFKTALLELADNHAQQKAVLMELLHDTQDIRDAYELQKEINALENEINAMLAQSLNLEKLLEPYLGPFSSLIESVTRTDHKLADSVREIQSLTDNILSDGMLGLGDSTEDKILDFLAHAQFSEKIVSYLADWDLNAIPPTEFVVQTADEANIEQALDNLQQFIKLRFPKAAQGLKSAADTVLEGEQLLQQVRERTQTNRLDLKNPEDLSSQQYAHYTAYDNGTVLDSKTGLMWMRCALGQRWDGHTCVGEAVTMNWETACQQKGDGFAGYTDWRIPTIGELKTLIDQSQRGAKIHPQAFYTDWRIPTIEELKTLVDKGQSGTTIHPQAFPNCPAHWFWSGSPYAGVSGHAWYVDFGDGYDNYIIHLSGNRVRLVRGGQ